MPPPDSRNRILIVDDDPATLETLGEFLGGQGYEVSAAVNGLDALLQLHTTVDEGRLPCLILLDLVMQVSGWQFREEQRKDPRLAAIPIVVMSGVYQPEPAAQNLGAAAYLPKPVDLELLLAIVRRFCD